jgi:hypothetical protein
MKTWLKWGIGFGAGLLGVGVGGGTTALLLGKQDKDSHITFSQMGRDRAFSEAAKKARTSILVRSTTLRIVPFVNELGNAAQKGIKVHLELPIDTNNNPKALLMIQHLAEVGVWIEVGREAAAAYEGSYMVIDNKQFYYSAAPLDLSEPGIPHSYVSGSREN